MEDPRLWTSDGSICERRLQSALTLRGRCLDLSLHRMVFCHCADGLNVQGFQMLRLLCVLLLLMPKAGSAMSIETEIQDLRPILAPNLYVTLSGPIEDGDADRLRDVLSRYDSHNLREIFVFLDSPGAVSTRGLRIAGVLGSRSEIVISQVGTDENPNAECASACVLAFIGADLRYLAANGRLGVHQFSHSGEGGLDTGEGIDIAQRFAAEIVALLKRQRVSSTLFAEMSNTPPNAITWLSSDKLERWWVVTGSVYEDRMEYRNLNGKVALYMFHESLYGTNEMTLFCDDGLIAYAILDEPPVAAVGNFSLIIDGSDNRIDSYEILNRDNGRTRVFMRIPPQVTARLAHAMTIGARVYTPAGTTFWGLRAGHTGPEGHRNCCQLSGKLSRTRAADNTGATRSDFANDDPALDGFPRLRSDQEGTPRRQLRRVSGDLRERPALPSDFLCSGQAMVLAKTGPWPADYNTGRHQCHKVGTTVRTVARINRRDNQRSTDVHDPNIVDANGPQLPSRDQSRCCDAALQSGLSLQPPIPLMHELTVCGTFKTFTQIR